MILTNNLLKKKVFKKVKLILSLFYFRIVFFLRILWKILEILSWLRNLKPYNRKPNKILKENQ